MVDRSVRCPGGSPLKRLAIRSAVAASDAEASSALPDTAAVELLVTPAIATQRAVNPTWLRRRRELRDERFPDGDGDGAGDRFVDVQRPVTVPADRPCNPDRGCRSTRVRGAALRRYLLAIVAALCCAPATASADSGAIVSITPTGGGMYLGTYTVSVDIPTSYGYYGGFGYAWQVAGSEACNPSTSDGRLIWVADGLLSPDVPSSQTGSDTFTPQYMPFKVCLAVSRSSRGDVVVAEQVYGSAPAPPPVPAAPVAVPAPVSTPAPVVTSEPSTDQVVLDRKCTYWSDQENKRYARWKSARKAYRKKRTAGRRRAMNRALAKLRTAERKAREFCG